MASAEEAGDPSPPSMGSQPGSGKVKPPVGKFPTFAAHREIPRPEGEHWALSSPDMEQMEKQSSGEPGGSREPPMWLPNPQAWGVLTRINSSTAQGHSATSLLPAPQPSTGQRLTERNRQGRRHKDSPGRVWNSPCNPDPCRGEDKTTGT